MAIENEGGKLRGWFKEWLMKSGERVMAEEGVGVLKAYADHITDIGLKEFKENRIF